MNHIRALLLTFLHQYAPELITCGYVYAAVPPLYKIVKNKTQIYLADDKALEEYKNEHKDEKYEIGRFKGLGEMDASEFWDTVMNPNTRTLKQITMEDIDAATKVFEDLMGNNVIPRKEFIAENAYKANIDA